MKAIVYRNYGSPDVLKYEEMDKPVAGDSDVLIKVRAAAVNPYDWHFMRGTPYPLRLQSGLRRPKSIGLGVDVAGEVEAIGRSVTQLQPGDEVFGTCRGAFAEYVCASESGVVKKAKKVKFEQAAAVPIAGLTALQGLRDKGKMQPGHEVLINGASGGVGTFAVQIAKSFGAVVTGVCSTRNVEMVRSIGADHVIDYTLSNFTEDARGARRYDLIFDAVGNHSFSTCRRVLNPGGSYVAVGGPTDPWLIETLIDSLGALVQSWFVSQKLSMFIAKANKEDLTLLQELMEAGKVKPVIDRCYGLREVPEALRYLEEGHARGKVTITV